MEALRRLFSLLPIPRLCCPGSGVLYSVQLAVPTILIPVRTWDRMKLLRWLIAGEIAAAIIGTVIDVGYFPDNLVFDFITLVPAALWWAYLFKSRRVVHVFESHDWKLPSI